MQSFLTGPPNKTESNIEQKVQGDCASYIAKHYAHPVGDRAHLASSTLIHFNYLQFGLLLDIDRNQLS